MPKYKLWSCNILSVYTIMYSGFWFWFEFCCCCLVGCFLFLFLLWFLVHFFFFNKSSTIVIAWGKNKLYFFGEISYLSVCFKAESQSILICAQSSIFCRKNEECTNSSWLASTWKPCCLVSRRPHGRSGWEAGIVKSGHSCVVNLSDFQLTSYCLDV